MACVWWEFTTYRDRVLDDYNITGLGCKIWNDLRGKKLRRVLFQKPVYVRARSAGWLPEKWLVIDPILKTQDRIEVWKLNHWSGDPFHFLFSQLGNGALQFRSRSWHQLNFAFSPWLVYSKSCQRQPRTWVLLLFVCFCTKIFFTGDVLCSLRWFKLKTEGQTI